MILDVERNKARKKLVVVGNGMAGARVVEEILKRSPDQFDIVMFGAEPYGNYNRILLSNVLNGTQQETDIFINPLAWYRDNNIRLHAGVKASHIDRKKRRRCGRSFEEGFLGVQYRRGVGRQHSHRRALRSRHHRHGLTPVCSSDGRLRRDGDFSLSNDRRLLPHCGLCQGVPARGCDWRRIARTGSRAGSSQHGVEVTVLEAAPQLMMAQLDPEAGDMLRRQSKPWAFTSVATPSRQRFLRRGWPHHASGIQGRFHAGNRHGRCQHGHPARSRKSRWLSGITVNRGIVCDDQMRTSDPAHLRSSANASNIGDSSMAWSIRFGSRPMCSRT